MEVDTLLAGGPIIRIVLFYQHCHSTALWGVDSFYSRGNIENALLRLLAM